ncbi:type II secretory pathway, component ExeA (predicted ATPase) [Burkholderiales bacterium JOSHI_001]|nr:type II secretory pathway, component ExeA (predicted ATPase) [Burkholderiales bacterium JOSHI_001]
MYAQHFGLKREPFSIAPDPRYLFMSARHREALAHLLYGLRGGGGFVLLTGEIGAGKTTIARAVLEQVPPHCNVAYIFNPKLTVLELLQTVCAEFHIALPEGTAGSKHCTDALNRYLLDTHAQGQTNVLIIDEAQNLDSDVLEQLRLLTNLETAERKLLQIVLIGQPELRQMLARPELEQLAQRVIARYHLQALSEAETRQYVDHRLGVAGAHGPRPFTRGALKRIHQLSRGVPRRINLLCDRALLGAYGGGRSEVDADLVEQAAREVFDSLASAPRPPWLAWVAGVAATGVVVLASALAWAWSQQRGLATALRAPATPTRAAAPLSAPGGLPATLPADDGAQPPDPPLPLDVASAVIVTLAASAASAAEGPASAASSPATGPSLTFDAGWRGKAARPRAEP